MQINKIHRFSRKKFTHKRNSEKSPKNKSKIWGTIVLNRINARDDNTRNLYMRKSEIIGFSFRAQSTRTLFAFLQDGY